MSEHQGTTIERKGYGTEWILKKEVFKTISPNTCGWRGQKHLDTSQIVHVKTISGGNRKDDEPAASISYGDVAFLFAILSDRYNDKWRLIWGKGFKTGGQFSSSSGDVAGMS